MDDPLQRKVFVDGAYKPFGELTSEDARKLAAGLRGVSGGGLEAKVMPVLTAWTELSRLLDSPTAKVADLDPDVAGAIAERVWVVPPGGTLLP